MRHLLTLTLWLITYSLFAQYAELGEIRQACDGYGGSVEIIFIGEGPIADYTYAWSHSGSQDLTLENLPVGEYEFYIQDRFGCSQTILFEITDPFICKPVFTSKWISQKCAYRVVVDFQTIEGVSINPSSFDVVWNYGNLVGSTVVLTFPTTSQQVLELCATYSLVNGEGNSCCSGTACVTLKRPTIIKPCYDPGCTLVVNEVGKKGDDSFVELVVVSTKDDCFRGCDLREVIIDDNNGNLINDPLPLDQIFSQNVSNGYLKLKDIPSWNNVPLGSMIVIYEKSKSGRVFSDPTDANKDGVYVVHAQDAIHLEGFTNNAQTGLYHYSFTGFPTNPKWEFIDPNPGYDGFQTVKTDNEVGHAIAFGQSASTHKGETATVYADYNNLNNSQDFIAALQDGNYTSSQSYVATTNTIVASPGRPNTVANETFIRDLLDCGKVSAQKSQVVTGDDFTFLVTPNPVRFHGEIKIRSSSERELTLRYSNVSGAEIFKQNITINIGESRLPLPDQVVSMPAGLYVVNVYAKDQFMFSRKFIVSK